MPHHSIAMVPRSAPLLWEERLLRAWPLFVLVGVLYRFFHGWYHMLWNAAPDQLAWGLILDEMVQSGTWSYSRLMFYPHEGGSLLVGLLSLPFRPLAGIMPPLSWVALVGDALSCCIQIAVVRRHFAPRSALLFTAWTVFSIPMIVPWATVNFGLHSLTAFAPFLLLHYTTGPRASTWKAGLACGVCIVLAYDCLVLLPAYGSWLLLQHGSLRGLVAQGSRFALGCALPLVPHALLRVYCDIGFHLVGADEIFSIRGLEWAGLSSASLVNILTTLHSTLPASFLISTFEVVPPRVLAMVVLGFILCGTIGAFGKRRQRPDSLPLIALCVGWFLLIYGISPLFTARIDVNGYFHYRHLCFIAPLLVLWMCQGFAALSRTGAALGILWVLLCSSASITDTVRTKRHWNPVVKATGWVVARKFGHDPQHLVRVIGAAPAYFRNDLLFGFGWGTTAAVFEGEHPPEPRPVEKLKLLWDQYPSDMRPMFWNGVEQAFDPGITPDLDERYRLVVQERLVR
ncbi:MAG: hypothetical protein JNL43_05110 [Flavobacteriales bacterium]|nr:hypothetical protein [Flavobacteriales bacterium]